MEELPVEIFDIILAHLTLTDWKCLRLTSRAIYMRLSLFSSYSHIHPISIVPKSPSGITLFEKVTVFEGIECLSLSNFNYTELNTLIVKSPAFLLCLNQITRLSFANATTLIDSRLFYDLLSYCTSLATLDLSYYKFFFLSHNFSINSKTYPSIKHLNLNGNTHLSDYAFNRLIASFPNIEGLHLLGIPLRSCFNSIENRTFLTFENFCTYFQKHLNNFQNLTISFDKKLPCDTQVKRLFEIIPNNFSSLYIDGTLTTSTLLHLLLLFDNCLQKLILEHLQLDHTGCQPFFSAINQYASNLKELCILVKVSSSIQSTQQRKIFFPVLNPSSDISLSSLKYLKTLDIQTLHPLNQTDLIALFNDSLSHLKQLALPINATDDVIKSLCTKSSFSSSLTHLNISNCLSISNRSILIINKYLFSLQELIINDNININDLAFIGLSICGIGKTIEWFEQTKINCQFINDIPMWTCTITHQTTCKCQLPNYVSSSCVKLRLKDFNFQYDEYSERILSTLVQHKLFNEHFYSINNLKNLKVLKLRHCIQITNNLFRYGIRSLPNLKILDVSLCEKLNDTNLSLIGQSCPSIESIDLTGCYKITENGKTLLKKYAKRAKIIDF